MADRNASSGPSGALGHPAPGRHKVGNLLLVVSFMLAPVAWSVQLAAIASLAGIACIGAGGVPLAEAPPAWPATAIRWINAGAIAVAGAGIVLAFVNTRRSREAAAPPAGGVVKSGEGRVHWMALGGLLLAVVSLIAVVANSIPVFMIGMCPL